MTQVCGNCGHSLATTDRFCPKCGTPVPGASPFAKPDVTGTIYALGQISHDSGPLPSVVPHDMTTVQPGSHVLLIVRGPASGSRIELVGDNMVAGRSPETAIFLDDITVSRQHARFDRVAEGWSLVDLGSLNGTYVNRDRADIVALKHGDEIQIGKYRFHYVTGSTSETAE